MHVVKHFFSAFMQFIMSIIWANSLLTNRSIEYITMIINREVPSFKDWVLICVYTFMTLFIIMAVIFFFGMTLYHLFMAFYCAFVTDNRVVHVAVDENDVIQDTFLELSNGKIIPIKITKLKMDKLKEEVTGEQK